MLYPTVIMVFDLNFLNEATGILMDVKVIMTQLDGQIYSLQIDTNRVVTLMTDQSTFFWLLVVLGFILNFYMIYVTCGYIIEERKNKKIIDAANKKGGKSEAFGDAPDQRERGC